MEYQSEASYKNLGTVAGVKITPREIDILACMLNGRTSYKAISDFLSISPKTVEVHIRNVVQKFGGGSWGKVRGVIEKTNYVPLLRHHYQILLNHFDFESSLMKVKELIEQEAGDIRIISLSKDKEAASLISHITRDLKKIGISVCSEKDRRQEPKKFKALYLISEKINTEVLEAVQQTIKSDQKSAFFIIRTEEKELPLEDLEDIKHVIFNEHDYHVSFFTLLMKLFPIEELENICANFKNQGNTPQGFKDPLPSSAPHQKTIPLLSWWERFLKSIFQTKKRQAFVASFLSISLVSGGYFIVKNSKEQSHITDYSVQSDLTIPKESSLLKRPELIAQIDEKLKSNQGIGTVALVGVVGMGGVGKTTVARLYGRSQKAPVVYELNAETITSLKNSFRDFGEDLAHKGTQAQKEEFNSIQKIQDSKEKEKKVLAFVKEMLKKRSHWLLIYDNVESIGDIKAYLPEYTSVWGAGKVLITTRNSNIKNSGYMNPKNVIQIDELTKDEALTLFSRILFNQETKKLSKDKKEEALNFLKNIPPFPLDISLAAYYLEATGASYKEYSERLKRYNQDFDILQEKIFRQASDYRKTRYNIIRLSIEELISNNKVFAELILFMCLLDSQNIPIDLLKKYKNNTLIDEFIFILKKYSLITYEKKVVNMHRSTQHLSLEFIKRYLNITKDTSIMRSISSTLKEYLKDTSTTDDERTRSAVRHGEAFLAHEYLLTGDTRETIRYELGRLYHYLGKIKKSKDMFEKCLSFYIGKYGYNYIKTGDALARLGYIHKSLGNYAHSKNLIEQAYPIYRKTYGKDHNKTGWILSILGNTYIALGEYRKAQSLLEEGLKIYQKIFGDNHAETAVMKIRYGRFLTSIGKYWEAKNILLQAIPSIKQGFGETHGLLAWNRASLGVVFLNLKDYDNAKTFLENSCKSLIDFYGENYPETAYAIRQLGNLHLYLNQYEQAETLLQKSLLIYGKLYGVDHIECAKVLADLGRLYQSKNDLERAEQINSKSLAILDKNSHPDQYICFEAFGDLYKENYITALKGKESAVSHIYKEKAITNYERALQILKQYFPTDSSYIMRLQEKLRHLTQGQ